MVALCEQRISTSSFPSCSVDSDAVDAARMIAEHGLPGLMVTDASRKPCAVLLAFRDAALCSAALRAGRHHAGRCPGRSHWPTTPSENLAGKTVGDVLPKQPRAVPSVDARDGVIKVAAEMAQLRSPLIAVTEERKVARCDHRVTPAGGGAQILSAASGPPPRKRPVFESRSERNLRIRLHPSQ